MQKKTQLQGTERRSNCVRFCIIFPVEGRRVVEAMCRTDILGGGGGLRNSCSSWRQVIPLPCLLEWGLLSLHPSWRNGGASLAAVPHNGSRHSRVRNMPQPLWVCFLGWLYKWSLPLFLQGFHQQNSLLYVLWGA